MALPRSGPAARDPSPSPPDHPRGHRCGSRCAGHHRQPRFHPPGGAAGACGGAVDPDHRLCVPDRMGVAAGSGRCHAALCRSRARGAAVRAGRAPPPRRPAMHLCRPSPRRAGRDAAPRSAGSRATQCRPARGPRPAGEPPRRDQAPHRGFRRGDGCGAGTHRRRRDRVADGPPPRRRGEAGEPRVAGAAADRRRSGGEMGRLPPGAGGARSLRDGHARTRARGGPDRHRLPGSRCSRS